MADRHARALADCGAVARARRARAGIEHADARRDQAQAADAAARARDGLAAAAAAWQAQLEGRFDPALGMLLGRHVLDRAAGLETSNATHAAAGEACTWTADRWRTHDGLSRGLDEWARSARRRTARQAEERQLAALADRLTFNWPRA